MFHIWQSGVPANFWGCWPATWRLIARAACVLRLPLVRSKLLVRLPLGSAEMGNAGAVCPGCHRRYPYTFWSPSFTGAGSGPVRRRFASWLGASLSVSSRSILRL